MTLVGVSVPLEVLAGGVFLDDDVPAVESHARVVARAEAVPADGRSPVEVARDVPVEVFVYRGGYETLRFTWRMADEPVVRRMARSR